MRVVIVAKTRMGDGFCIGGLVEATAQSVRIIRTGAICNPANTLFRVGDIWELDLKPRARLTTPHVEDHDFTTQNKVGVVPQLRNWILSKVRPWAGGVEALFDGALQTRTNGTAFVPTSGKVSRMSTGFWTLPLNLEYAPLVTGGEIRPRYLLLGRPTLQLPYVGVQPHVKSISRGALVRLSLSRAWKAPNAPADEEPRHWLQLSGWY